MTINRGCRRITPRAGAAMLAGAILACALAPGPAAAWSGDPDWHRRHGQGGFFDDGGRRHWHGWDDRFGGEGFGGAFLFAPPLQQPLYAPPPVVYVPQPPLFVPLPSDVEPAYQGGPYQGSVPGTTTPGRPASACYSGPYVCPLTAPAPVGTPCSCPVGSGRRIGGQAG